MNVEQETELIKTKMPETYKAIQAKAAEIGRQAFALVRRGLSGEPDCFYTMESGYVMGTPFAGKNLDGTSIMDEIARYMVQFGCSHIVVFANVAKGQS